MGLDWIPPRWRGPAAIVLMLIAAGVFAAAFYRTFAQDDFVSGSFILLMGGGWLWYGIYFWIHRPRG